MADEFSEGHPSNVPKDLTPSRKQFLDTQYLEVAYKSTLSPPLEWYGLL